MQRGRFPEETLLQCTIVWADIDRFTEISRFLTRRGHLLPFVREFYKLVERAASTWGVIREKFVGDGALLLVLPSPSEPAPPDLDLDPGIWEQIQTSLKAIHFSRDLAGQWSSLATTKWNRMMGPIVRRRELRLVFGIHRGTILALTEPAEFLGPAPIRPPRQEVIGHAINLACRLVTLDSRRPQARIFISEDTCELLQANMPIVLDGFTPSPTRGYLRGIGHTSYRYH